MNVQNFMTARKKIFDHTESREIFIRRRNRNKKICGFCPECQKEVEILTLDEVTSNTGKRTRELFRMVENNSLHSIETSAGRLLVCRNSLETQERKYPLIKTNEEIEK